MVRKPPLGVVVAIVACVLLSLRLWWGEGAAEQNVSPPSAEQARLVEGPSSAGAGGSPSGNVAAIAAPSASPTPPALEPPNPGTPTGSGSVAASSVGGGEGVVPPPVPPGGVVGGGEPPRRGALADPVYRARRVADLDAENQAAYERARRWADANNEPMRVEVDGGVTILVDYTEEGGPIYRSTFNLNAGISSAANLIRTSPYNVDGTGIVAGIWDGGNVRATHTEFANGRVTNFDAASLNDHATHVAGTMIARGARPTALGMAPAAQLIAYDFVNDLSEMNTRAMAAPGEAGKVQVSNHSYGAPAGWSYRTNGAPRWYGTWSAGVRESDSFGRYSATDQARDKLIYEAPYYLPFVSAGNDRNQSAPASGTTFEYFSSGQWRSKAYDPNTDPLSDWQKGGYNTIPFGNNSKNAVVVGAVNDAVNNGQRDISKATMSDFSSWGQTDDGRIKPDIVANGVDVTSSVESGDFAYNSVIFSGTSMSAPNASGSALLLLQHWANLFPGQFLWNSTIKGLIIHTADTLDEPGPDYRNGWGLMNAEAAADHISVHAARPDVRSMVEEVLNTSQPVVEYPVIADGSSALKATLVWTDPPGPERTGLNNTNRVLVNDLDLRIIGPDGVTTYFPWVLNPASPAQPAIPGDNVRDNIEQVYIASPPQPGVYRVRVSHKGTLTGNQQHFSLFVSGFAESEFPETVAGVVASALSSVSIDLTWVTAAHATSYKIWRDGAQIATVSNGTSFKDMGLAPSTDYVYRIVAANYRGDAQPSEPVTVRTRDWIEDHPFVLLITNPSADLATSSANFSFSGLVGANVSAPLSWSNRLTGQTGSFGRSGFGWNTTVPLAIGTNLVDFRGTYEVQEGSDAGDSSDYADGWTSGDNGGSVFLPWQLQIAAGGEAFVMLDENHPSGRVFGLWSGLSSSAVAWRPFPALSGGGAVSLEFRNLGLAATGRMGFEFSDAGDRPRLVFHSAAPGQPYRIHDGAGTNSMAWSNSAGFSSLRLSVSGDDTYTLTLNGSQISGALLPGGAMAKLKIFSEGAAEPPAYRFSETMQYAVGSSLAGRNGGTGFAGAWTGGSSTIVAGPAHYPAWVSVGTNYSTRTLSTAVTTGAAPLYFSMVIRSADFTAGTFSGFALTQASNPVNDLLFFGIPWRQNAFGLDLRQNFVTDELKSIPNLQTSTPHLVVCGLIPGSVNGRVDVKMWVTTNTAQDISTLIRQAPAINVEGAQGKANFTFNQIKLTGDYAGAVEFAELRSFDAVRPRENYELLVRNLGWEGYGVLASAPSVLAVFQGGKTDGIPDAWWDAYAIPTSHRSASADWDGDGLSNLVEYFAGLDPTVVDAAATFPRFLEDGVAHMDYRRSKLAEGIRGSVSWSKDLGAASIWSGEGVSEVLLEDHDTYEIRRARVPWLSGDGPIFLRLGLTLD
jgi:hypothetical protein